VNKNSLIGIARNRSTRSDLYYRKLFFLTPDGKKTLSERRLGQACIIVKTFLENNVIIQA